MARYLIENAEYGVCDGGIACGPCGDLVVAEIKVKEDGGEEYFISLAEIGGVPNFYKTEKSTFEMQMRFDMTDEEIEEFNKHFIDTGDYDDIFADSDFDEYELFRYLIYLVRAEDEECNEFIEATKGKYVDEMDIPLSDLERERLFDDEEVIEIVTSEKE